MAARIGGDEFVVLAEHLHEEQDAITIAQRVSAAIEGQHVVHGHEVQVQASIGIVHGNTRHKCAMDVIRDADLAMYHAKSQSHQTCIVFDEQLHEAAMQRLDIETRLRRALDADEFNLSYQPVVCLESGELAGFEALLRWKPETCRAMTPDMFIPIAEETGLIVPIGQWVHETACRQLAKWHKSFPRQKPLTMAINLSRRQLLQPQIVDQIVVAARDAGVCPAHIALEITESLVMEQPAMVSEILERLRHAGFAISMDDFGTGHSSLGCLYRFPFDVVKIDRSFVAEVRHRHGYAAVVQSIVQLAHNVDMKVVAEGVETVDQFVQLMALDCDMAQGYLFSEPLSVEDAEQFIRAPRLPQFSCAA